MPSPSQSTFSIAGRAVLVWLLLIAAEIAHGIIRAVTLVPLIGEFRSNQVGVFCGSAIIVAIAYLTIRWIGATRRSEHLLVGTMWVVLTITFEVVFGRLVMALSWERIAADYNLWKGGLMPLGLLVLLFAPCIAARMHHSTTDQKENRP